METSDNVNVSKKYLCLSDTYKWKYIHVFIHVYVRMYVYVNETNAMHPGASKTT